MSAAKASANLKLVRQETIPHLSIALSATFNLYHFVPLQDEERSMHPCSVASLIAVRANIWERWDPKPPHELREFDEKKAADSGEVLFPATGGDLFLFVKSHRVDLCFEVTKLIIAALGPNVESWDQTLAFGYMGGPYGGKDLTGYVAQHNTTQH